MTMNETQLIVNINEYFKKSIFENHINTSIKKHTKLSSYKINPIVVKYLSKILEDNFTPIGIAKALYLPRVLGTSINTSFGTRIQNMFVELELAEGSLIKGMDIEFVDKIDRKRKYCQLKSGPNTINSEDVNPLLKKFNTVLNLARTNKGHLSTSDLILGVLYGDESQLSQHYHKIDKIYPVIIGRELWHRITGYENFYSKLITSLDEVILNLSTDKFLIQGYTALAKEVEESELFEF